MPLRPPLRRAPGTDGTLLFAGVAAVWLGFLAGPPQGEERVLHLRGEGLQEGWYAAPTLAEAVRQAGGSPPTLRHGQLVGGASVDIVGEWAIVASEPAGVNGVVAPAILALAGGRVRLNTASLQELESLPRVGPVLAARIVAGRPYQSVSDLDRVKGVGPATLRTLEPLVQP